MNKARAMLDALMGPCRDQAKDANSTDWKDRSVCRGYLVGFCPCDKAVLGGKRTLDVCPKIHSDPLRSKFEQHPDSGEESSFRIRCEEICLRDCEWALVECESWSKKELERLKREPKPRRLPAEVNQKISATKREIEQLKLKAETLDDCDAKQKENLLKQAQTMADDIEAYQKAEETKAIDALPKGATCDICGSAYTGDEEYEKHLKYKVHEGYVSVRAQIDLLRQKREARDEAEKNKKEEDRKRKSEDAISKDETANKSDDEKKDKEKKKERSRSRDDKKKDKKASEKDRSRSRDDKKKDKKGSEKDRSRSRDEKKKDKKGSEKDRSRSRDEKKKGKDKGKRSRSRDSMGRDRGRDKDKAKGKDRSRDRGKSKDRSRERDKKKEKGRSRSRSRDRGKDKDRDKKRSRSRSKRKSRSRSRKRR